MSERAVPSQRERRIDRFDGTEHAFLSNFYPSPITGASGIVYPTVEHAFQAAKTADHGSRLLIARLPTPGKAKRAGRALELDGGIEGWNARRDHVMRHCLRLKFVLGGRLALMLMATDDAELVEGNTWGDRYWGVVDGVGENRLGNLLMERRAELRAQLTEEATRAA